MRDTLALVLSDVVEAYADLLLQQQAFAIAQAQIKLLDDQVAETNARFRLSTGTLTDVARLTAQRDSATSTQASAEASRKAAAARYRAVVGYDAGTLVAPTADLEHLPPGRDEARVAALARNPLVRQAVAEREAADARIGVARAAGAPASISSAATPTGSGHGRGSTAATIGALRRDPRCACRC